MLDRIDIQIQVPRLNYKEMKNTLPAESSATIRTRVKTARNIQLKRLKETNFHCNADMGHKEIKQHCLLETQAEILLEKYFVGLGLSARSHDRIIKVAQTIADLDSSRTIAGKHIAEAIQLRTSSL